MLPVKIDDKFYHLNLTDFQSPDKKDAKTPKRSYHTDRGSTIKKSTLQSLKKEVKVTFSNNFFVKSHNIQCSERIKQEIGRQFAQQAPELREFRAAR